MRKYVHIRQIVCARIASMCKYMHVYCTYTKPSHIMNHSNNSVSYDNVSDSPYSLRPTASIYAVNDQRSNHDTTAGGPRYTSTPSDSNHALSSSPSLTDRRQDIPPQPSPAELQSSDTTELTPTAVQNNTGFSGNGDHTYPPIRPPIGEDSSRETGRPNITVETNAALAKWDAFDRQQQRPIVPACTEPFQLIAEVPTAVIHLPVQERFVGPEYINTALDPASFADPECQVHSLDGNMESSNDSPQQCRLLSKREVNRRLNVQSAGMGYDSEPYGPGPAAGRSTQGPRGPALAAAVVVHLPPPPSQGGARGAMRFTSLPAVVVSVHPPPSQVATGPSAASILMTPRDLRYLDYVLDGLMIRPHG